VISKQNKNKKREAKGEKRSGRRQGARGETIRESVMAEWIRGRSKREIKESV
jgi:hypothetical protein